MDVDGSILTLTEEQGFTVHYNTVESRFKVTNPRSETTTCFIEQSDLYVCDMSSPPNKNKCTMVNKVAKNNKFFTPSEVK